MPAARISLVTDSTASLSAEVAAEHGISMVPVQVIVGATAYDDGTVNAQMVADALRDWTPVSTSRPNPSTFLETYQRLADEGATEILSIHISSELSGTFESAQLAAKESPVPVTVVDSRQTAFALGYAVLAAARELAEGGSVLDAVAAAEQRAEDTVSLFYVDTLEYLRRGGRVTTVQALFGGALSVKPLLRLNEGRIDSFEKVRTAGKALARLEDLAVAHADGHPVELTVGHLASPDRAKQLADKLGARLDLVGEPVIAELGAVLGAHVGPGMVAAVVAPALDGDAALGEAAADTDVTGSSTGG